MPDRVDLDRSRRLAGQLNSLGGKIVAGRLAVRTAAWTIERMAEEIESLRAERIAQAARRKPREFCAQSFRLYKPVKAEPEPLDTPTIIEWPALSAAAVANGEAAVPRPPQALDAVPGTPQLEASTDE